MRSVVSDKRARFIALRINDRIYGEFEIREPIILEVINTRPFQRLKRVNQYGGVNLVFPDKYQISRYEHSLGVWHVLRSLGAPLEIQVAGLLHDLGHTAFSHMVDMAMASFGEDYHEKNMHLIEGLEEIETALRANNIALRDGDACPEIKKSLPDVGADRVDYAVRDFVGATNTRHGLGRKVLANISLIGRDVVFTEPAVAREFALTGLEAMWLCIYEPAVACVYQALTEMIRTGVKEKWIRDKDLFGDDQSLFEIIRKNKDRFPAIHFKIFTTPFTVEEVEEEDCDFKHVKLKARYFDPYVLVDVGLKRLSSIDSEFREKLEPMKKKFEERKRGAYFKVVFAD